MFATGYSEDIDQNQHYLKKIDELVKKKMNTFALEDAIAAMFEDYITNEMNGNDTKLVIKKKLYASDLLRSQNRLSMPINQLETDEFMTEIEKRELAKGKEFEVRLLGPRLQMHDKPMVLKMWHLRYTSSYVLKTNWNDFVKKNEEVLKENTKIYVWSFRAEEKLCFALACMDYVA